MITTHEMDSDNLILGCVLVVVVVVTGGFTYFQEHKSHKVSGKDKRNLDVYNLDVILTTKVFMCCLLH